MRAIRYYGQHDIRLEDVAPPAHVGAREVLVAPRFCGICGTDLHEYVEGARIVPTKPHPMTGAALPQILGHEVSAQVIEVGAQVNGIKKGDRVALMPLLYCGRCYFCSRGLNHLCVHHACVGLSWPWGGFAEQAVVPDYTVVALPDQVSYEQGALLEPAAVGAYAVERGGVQGGESVLVAGAGPIGVFAVLYAKALGAGSIYVTETNSRRLDLIRSFGITDGFNPLEAPEAGVKTIGRDSATGVFDAAKSWVVDAVRESTDGLGVDVAIDCTGNAAGLDMCINAVRSRGAVVESALHTTPPNVDMRALVVKDVRLESTWCYNVYDFPRYASLIAAGRLPVEKAITKKISLEEVEDEGFKVLTDPSGIATKILVYPERR